MIRLNNAKNITTKTGSGTAYTYGAAVSGFQTIANLGNNAVSVFCCDSRPFGGTVWEYFVGRLTTSNTRVTRIQFLSSSTGSTINWTSGQKHLSVSPSAEQHTEGTANEIDVIDDEVTGARVHSLAQEVLDKLPLILTGETSDDTPTDIADGAIVVDDATTMFIRAYVVGHRESDHSGCIFEVKAGFHRDDGVIPSLPGAASMCNEIVDTICQVTFNDEIVNEIQTFQFFDDFSGGDFTITIDGHTTVAIAWDADAAEIQPAITALPNVTDCDVTGGPPLTDETAVEITSPVEDFPQLTLDISGLTGGSIDATIETTTEGESATADDWTSQVSANGNDWRAVVFGNGLFVAVSSTGTGNRVMTSPDGETWTIRASAYDALWVAVVYGGGQFVAVAESAGIGNRVMTSPNGIDWTARTSVVDGGAWTGVAYGNGLFVAVARSGTHRVMTSPDGENWTARTAASDNNWQSVTFGNGLFVAVSNTGTGNRVMTSPDGETWTSRTSAADNSWESVTYGNGLFVAVSTTGTGNRVMTSPDGITWSSRTSAADNSWQSVTYGSGLFVAVSYTGSGNRVQTSPDGINWTIQTTPTGNAWYGVGYGGGKFVAVSITGTSINRVMSSVATGGINERHTLTIVGTPIQGWVVLSIQGESADVPFYATAADVETLLNTILGSDSVTVTGGPLPDDPIVIEFTGNGYESTDISDSTVDPDPLKYAIATISAETTQPPDVDIDIDADTGEVFLYVIGQDDETFNWTAQILIVVAPN